MEEGWIPPSAQRSSSQRESHLPSSTSGNQELDSRPDRLASPEIPFYFLSSSAALPSSQRSQESSRHRQSSSSGVGRSSSFTSPMTQDYPPGTDRVSSPFLHGSSQGSCGAPSGTNGEQIQAPNLHIGHCHDLTQLSSVEEDRLLPPPRIPSVQGNRTPVDQQQVWHRAPIICHEIIDDPNQRRNSKEAQSQQLSDGLGIAVQSSPDELLSRDVEALQPPRAYVRRLDSPPYGYNDEQREAGDDRHHGDYEGDHWEAEYSDGEDEEWNEYVGPQDCDWGTNGQSGPADWNRINAEDQMFLNGYKEPVILGESDTSMPNHGVYPADPHVDQPREATIDETDFCQDSEEERRAISQQLRLSQPSSGKIDHPEQPQEGADAFEKSSAAKGKARASDSQVREMHAPYPSKNLHRDSAKRSGVRQSTDQISTRRSTNTAILRTGERSLYCSAVHGQGHETSYFGSPKLGGPGELPSQAKSTSSLGSQSSIPSQQRKRPSQGASSRRSSQTQQRQRSIQSRPVQSSGNQSRQTSSQPTNRPTPTSNHSHEAACQGAQFIPINIKREPEPPIQSQPEQDLARRLEEKKGQRARNLELVRKSEEWERKYGSGRLATEEEEDSDTDDDGAKNGGGGQHGRHDNQRSRGAGNANGSDSSSESEDEDESMSDDLVVLGSRVIEGSSDSTSTSSESESESERVADGWRRRRF